MFLSANSPAIRAAGYDLAYPGRDDIPGGRLRLRLPGPGDYLQNHLAEIQTPEAQALILSEENIPGSMRPFFKGEFFPGIRRRLKMLRDALPGPVARVLYVVRPYDELFVSGYRKWAEDNPVPPFDTFIDGFLGLQGGWPHVVSALRDVFDQAEVVVLSYANRGSNAELFQRLVPEMAAQSWEEPQRLVNLSATDAGLIALQQIYAEGRELRRKDWQAVIADHANQKERLGFAAFPDDARQMLVDRYAQDLEDLAQMSGVEFQK